ncbi:ATP-binding cassette domain-containing protein [Pilimelia columellifera]|uniref:ATP-binding cassette domain-containing protein n=1 Tax=Pilimelia columellifera subsp. columellifera TaxID=706583 RepID=A0ABP6A8X1_9ACTN
MTPELRIEGISRRFGERLALDEVSFTVPAGRLTGFIGGNGAGKTTTMRIVLGVLAAHGGRVRWQGADIDALARRRFGYMPEERGLYPKMGVADQLVYLARLHGLDPARARRNVADLLERLGLAARAKEPLEKLSLGNQQRAQLAAALAHDPVALVLDEPFSGLDPGAVDDVAGVLRERAATGVPVLFSSHQLDLVERLCDQLVIIAGGQIRASGDREQLRRAHAADQHLIVVDEDAGWLRELPGVRLVSLDGPRAVVVLSDPSATQKLLRAALDRGPVHQFTPVIPTLTEIFRKVSQ